MSARFHLYLSGIVDRSRSWAAPPSASADSATAMTTGRNRRAIMLRMTGYCSRAWEAHRDRLGRRNRSGRPSSGRRERRDRRTAASGLSGPLTPDDVQAVHVGPHRVGDDDRPVLLLIVLEDGNQRPADGQPRAVQCVDELRPAGAARPEPDARPPRLKALGV